MEKHRGTKDAASCVVPTGTLLEVGNREIWQMELVSRDRVTCGRIVRQLVEAEMYTIRYLIVYDMTTDRHVPVPANAVTEITSEAVFCSIDAIKFLSLPKLTLPLDRAQEEEIYGIIEQTPYWIEEAAFIHTGPEPGISE